MDVQFGTQKVAIMTRFKLLPHHVPISEVLQDSMKTSVEAASLQAHTRTRDLSNTSKSWHSVWRIKKKTEVAHNGSTCSSIVENYDWYFHLLSLQTEVISRKANKRALSRGQTTRLIGKRCCNCSVCRVNWSNFINGVIIMEKGGNERKVWAWTRWWDMEKCIKQRDDKWIGQKNKLHGINKWEWRKGEGNEIKQVKWRLKKREQVMVENKRMIQAKEGEKRHFITCVNCWGVWPLWRRKDGNKVTTI
jgi:hypothetical protein